VDTEQALADLGVTPGDFSEEQRQRLDQDGYFVVPGYLNGAQVDELRSEFDRWEREAVPRHDLAIEPGTAVFLHDLFNKSSVFDYCLRCRPTLAAAHHLLGEIHVYSLNGRNPAKGRGQQALHSDVPRVAEDGWRLVNTMIMLDDMTEDNGATRLVPGSHKWPSLNVPEDNLSGAERPVPSPEEQSMLPADPLAPHPSEVKVTGTAGSVCVINAHIWHGGTLNRTGAKRRLLHMAIGRRDITQQFNQQEHLTPALFKRATPAEQYLLDIEGAQPVAEDYPGRG
jgi:ectoine hydroxylase-related dioxygenase (phytanoyl-CoA dioxygenase family)